MNRSSRVGGNYSALVLCAALLLAMTVGCTATDRQCTNPPPPADTRAGSPAQLPLTLENIASAVAVNDRGVYVADTGVGNDIDPNGHSFGSDNGRVLVLEAGSNAPKELANNLGAPRSLAVASDGTVYVLGQVFPGQVMRIDNGVNTPVPLPFNTQKGGDGFPRQIAYTVSGDVVLLTSENIQILPKGAPSPTTIEIAMNLGGTVAVHPDGAIYYTESDRLLIVDKGAMHARTLPTEIGRKTVAMAFDNNGDRYVINQICDAGRGQDTTVGYTYSLLKFTNDSTKPIDIPAVELTSPTGIAVGKTDIYVADGKRVLKFPKP